MRAVVAITCLLALGTIAHAQMLDTSRPLDLENWVCFNPAFLSANGIDSVLIRSQSKTDGRPLRNSNDRQVLTFDRGGRLTSTSKTRAVAHLTDSSSSRMTYGAQTHWLSKVEHSGASGYTFNPTFDALGRVTRMECLKHIPHLKDSIYINIETFTWSTTDSTESVLAFNNYELPYERRTTCTSPEGFLLWETTEFVVTHRVKRRTFTYNERAWLSEVIFTNSHNTQVEKHVYNYDGLGKLTSVEVWQDQLHSTTFEVVYDDLDRIDGIIRLDTQDRSMAILNFSYPLSP